MITIILELNNHHTKGKRSPIGSMQIERIPNAYRVVANYTTKDGEFVTTSFVVDKPEHNRHGQSVFNLAMVMIEKLIEYDWRFGKLYLNNPPTPTPTNQGKQP